MNEKAPKSDQGIKHEDCGDYGHVILVPVEYPVSAKRLIELSIDLACPEDGRIVVLIVATQAAEQDAQKARRIEEIVEAFQNDGHPVELHTRFAGTVSRGILDAAREEPADLVLLGLHKPVRSGVSLDQIAENVIPAAPCPVILYRPSASLEFDRVLIPIGEGSQGHLASQMAIRLGDRRDKPVEALYLEHGEVGAEGVYWSDISKREAALADVPGRKLISQQIIATPNPGEAILSNVSDHDLMVVDLSDEVAVENWIEGEAPLILRKWKGSLVVVAPGARTPPRNRLQRLKRLFTPTLAPFEQQGLEREEEGAASPSLDYLVLIAVSAILASLGLLLNSNAVIIGAMLVAPLMSPLIAFATGMTLGQGLLVRRATITLLLGIAVALVIAILIGFISPTNLVTTEMAARGNPSFLDLAVAFASGFIGAYATARKSIASAAAGVAIAAALMPPLTTVGLAVAFGDYGLAQGSALLFVTNIVSIILAAWATFVWLGMRHPKDEEEGSTKRTTVILAVVFIVVLVGLMIQNLNTSFTATIERVLQDSFQQASLVSYTVRQGDPVQVRATILQPADQLTDTSEIIDAQNNLEEALGEPVNLEVVIDPLVDANVAITNAELEAEIYRILEETMPSSQVIEITFLIGNPTLVLAIVQSELPPESPDFKSEVQAAEDALNEWSTLPVDLHVVTTHSQSLDQVDATNDELETIIEETLNESLQYSTLVDFAFTVGNPFVVAAHVTTETDPTSDLFADDIQSAEEALAAALGFPVRLTVIVVKIEEEPAPTPEIEEPAPTDDGVPTEEVEPTLEPPQTQEPPATEPPPTDAPLPTETPEIPPTAEPPPTETPEIGATDTPPTEEAPTPEP